MAINLLKMLDDLQTGDEDIKVLALGTLLQYDFTPLAAQRDTLVGIRDFLESSPQSFGGDMGFLYRQVLEKLRSSPVLVTTAVDDGTPSSSRSDSRSSSGEESRETVESSPAQPAGQASPSSSVQTASFSPSPSAGPAADLSGLDDLPQASAGLPFDLSPLRGDDPEVQVDCLMTIKRDVIVDARGEVLELLAKTKNERVIASCASALAAVGFRDDVPRLRPFLGHPDGRVRANTVETIERLASTLQILIFITPLTRDFCARVRNNALRALARIGRENILRALKALLEHSNVNLRGNALYVIENLSGNDVFALLKLALQDSSEFVRMEALNILARRPGPTSRMLIESCANDPHESVRTLVRETLAATGSGAPGPAVERVDLTGLASHLDPEGELPDLGSLVDGNVEMQIGTLKKVARAFVDDARGYVIEILQGARDNRLIEAALAALAAVGLSGDGKLVIPFLSHDAMVVRRAAVDALVQIGSPRDILTWLTPQLMTEDPLLRQKAMIGLIRFRPQVLVEHFRRLLQATQLPIRVTGLWALACFGGEAARVLLVPLADDQSPEIRRQLARALALRSEAWVDGIMARLAKDDDSEVATAAAQTLRGSQQEDEREERTTLTTEQVAEEAQAAGEVDDEEMLSKSFVGDLATLQSGGALSTLFGKLSAKKHSSLAELSRLDKKQREIYHSMGVALVEAIERGEVNEPAFANAVSMVQKYRKLLADRSTRRQDSDTTAGFLSSILTGGGGGEDDKDIEITMRQQCVFLGKAAWKLHRDEGRSHGFLHDDYEKIRALEERMAVLVEEDEGT